VAGSCLVIVTSGCLASVLNQFSIEVQSISPLSSCSTATGSTGTDRCAGTKLIAVLCRLVPTYRMVAPVLIDAQGNQTEDILKTEALGIHPIRLRARQRTR
jgi:hypothetical protein